jgi:GT2 family glycosyltransferase/ubiquinone/menaquinone biosynthesis C-methylase UbiE
MLEWTGERYLPWIREAEIGYEHLHRYAFASQFVRNKKVLDLACGEGYGSELLAQTAKYAVGIDIDQETIKHAQNKYIRSNLEFKVGSILEIPLQGTGLFDVVVCFEALEHVNDHEKLLAEVKRVLTPDGLFFVSTPNKTAYSDEPHFNNPYHLHELYFDEFKVELEGHFRQVKVLGQRIYCNSNLWPVYPEENTSASEFVIERGPQEFTFVQAERRTPIYFLAVASNGATDIGAQVSVLVDISNELVSHRDHTIQRITAERDEAKAKASFLAGERTQLLSRAQAQQQLLVQRQEMISRLNAAVTQRDRDKAALDEVIRQKDARFVQDVAWLQSLIANHEKVIAERVREISALAARVSILDGIYASNAWKAITLYYKFRDSVLPEGTLRKSFLKAVFNSLVTFKTVLRSRKTAALSNEGPPAVVSPTGGHEEASVQPAIGEDLTSEPQHQPSTAYFAVPNSVDDASQNEEYQALTDRISALRKSHINGVQPNIPNLISISESEFTSSAQSLFFQPHAVVRVSIVIPVFNNLKFTLECLTALMLHSLGSYEIIIVDDASTDQTQQVLSYASHIVYIRNEKNLGFVHSCNRGAERARGKYLVFLNNDVQVTENWLDSLLNTFEEHGDAGAVGPKILFPDGRLQEAGALVNRDGTSRLVGVFDHPDLQRYNYTREVMYCSGACLAVDAKTFKELGGFETSLAPAYCEDWDLAFRIRKRGLRVFYNPQSVVIHHLSASSNAVGRDFKTECIVRNQQKLSERWQSEIDTLNQIRLIAFYLPQFHPIPENDRWWGKGFTEWMNVAKARPNYAGHYQPHLPADLGFYDLRIAETMDQQSELAKRYGLYGFCYFYYWFGGKRLLDLPLERLIGADKNSNRFCLAWANENWTRTWDGLENEILIGQRHSDDDDRAVILDMIRYFRQPNYIRINGKPLLIVYRINLFPNIHRTTEIWREQCIKEGVGDIYLALVESFENAGEPSNPVVFGFDASVEYPPHRMSAPMKTPSILNPDFEGSLHDYREIVLKYLQREVPCYTRFRTVMPSWDNTPRRQNNPYVFEYARPGNYRAWLEAILEQTHEQNFGDERIVFINAWNEWGEGNHLEPDKLYGHGFLEATRNAQDTWLLKQHATA